MSKLTRSYSSKINSILKKILKEEEKKFLECAKKHRVSLTDETWHRLLTRSLDDPMIQWELKTLGVKLAKNLTNRTFNSVYYKYTARK